MKLFSTIIFLAATADARRRKKSKNTEVEESSGEGSGVAPVTAEEAILVVDDIVDDIVLSAESNGESTRALKRRIQLLKNLNALQITDGACSAPYDADKFGGDDFANWAASVSSSGDRCADSTTIQIGVNHFLDNYACTDGVGARTTKRWERIISKISNYC
ncbi:unnamed protein product [Oikopleura dioica]|uniref:Uncharacterized protein n=1 Tax=Oikopleura dioica TaxID=34765 RepID=E4Z2R9_OIKDI|nr:unnamed protein product [Oikopleura dioica]